jgi:phage tail sheath protein FI
MALYLSPLVDVNEIDLSTTIPAVATSIAVIAIRDPFKGPELKKQLITTIDELIDVFGEPTSGSYKDILAAAGYLKYGNKLYATAVQAPSASYAGVHGSAASGDLGDWSGYSTSVSGAYVLSDFAGDDPDEFGDETIPMSANREDFTSDMAFIAKTRGKWGNFVQVCYFGANIYDDVRHGIKTYAQIGISEQMYNDIDDADVSFDSTTSTEFVVMVKVAAQDQIDLVSPSYSLKEVFMVSTNPRKVDDEGTNLFAENFINQNSRYVRFKIKSTAHNTDMSDNMTSDWEQFTGGRNRGSTIIDADIMAAHALYEDPETIDINLLIDADKSTTVKSDMITIAEARKDTMAVLDVPQSLVVNNRGNETTDMRDFRLGLHSTYNLNENTSYAALYGNWLEIYDKWNARYRWIPSSGHMAGIYAKTDDVSDPWFAPAGLNRALITNIRRLAFNPNQANRDIAYKNGINPIVSFAGQGKVVWGQKTMLDKSSAFNRINVRRLFIILEKAISTAVKYFLFEPNDSFTRLQLINMIEPFLRDVRSRRGIYDYLVVCDSTNNTAERIDRNELWCDIYIKPTRAAEFIVLNFIATKTGASFTELVNAGATPTS